MKTPEERGPVGAWAYTARQDAELSVEEVTDRLGMRGVSVSPATLRGIEGGSKRPGRVLLSALSEIYGVHPPSLNGTKTAGEYAEIVAAIDRQTEAMVQLLQALAGGRTEVPPSVLQEVEGAEADLAAERGSGTPHQSGIHPEP